MVFASLYDQKVIQDECKKIEVTTKQRNIANEWVKKIKNNELKKEVENYNDFRDEILIELLGYPREEIKFEEKDVEFSIKDAKGITHVVFEAKGTKTKDLFARQNYGKREQEHPVIQTVSDMQRFAPPAAYGVCTNYNDFVLLDRELGITKCHRFRFSEIENNLDKLREFLGIFSYKNLVKEKSLEIIYEKSITAEKEFTREFYKLYHETRLMLIREFQDNTKERVTRTEAVYLTQIFLNRLIFIFFVEDKGYVPDKQLFAKRIFGVLESDDLIDVSKRVYDAIAELFVAFDVGSGKLGIFGFNGELFSGIFPQKIFFLDLKDPDYFTDLKQNSSLLKTTKLNEKSQKIIRKFGDELNPIISNLLIMESFDFNTEVNVNILGHIFEQSISDIKDLNKNTLSKRKKDGVYYTTPKLTEYICKNSIIPYLSKYGANTVEKLMNEYKGNIEELEKKFREIKILDPACGSGAFLTKAIDVLLEIGEGIQKVKDESGKYNLGKQIKLTKWNEDTVIREIIEKNIYGVDINQESIGITRLSLFLKLASNNRKLISLSKNIQVGNSLVDDLSVDKLAFLWEERFPNVFLHPNLKKHIDKEHVDGFDVIIGNPPWQIVKPSIDEFFSPLYDSMNTTEKFSLLTKIKKNNFIKKSLANPQIQKEWDMYEESYKKQMNYFNDSGKYPHQISLVNDKKNASDLNLYKLFVEKSTMLLKENGICGLVMPAGIYADLGSKGLRELIFKKNKLNSLISFVNNGIFEDVHYQFKFCIVLFERNSKKGKFHALFNQKNANSLHQFNEKSFEYNLELVEKSSPNSLSLLECSSKEEEEILEKMYKFPLLEDSFTWNIRARSEFHLTGDSDLFHTSKIGYPLFEGKMIHQFRDDLSPPRYWIEENIGISSLEGRESSRIKKIAKNKIKIIKPKLDCNQYRLVWRDITNATNERGMIATILPPKVFLGNTLNYIYSIYFDGEKYVPTLTKSQLLYLCGVLNSFPTDFVLRHKISSHANIFYVKELPIPEYDPKNSFHEKICKNSAKLICVSKEFDDLSNEIGVNGIRNPNERKTLIAQINALSAKIYGLTEEDLKLILQNFPIVDASLKELVLEEFVLLK